MWTKIASLVLLWTCVSALQKEQCPDHLLGYTSVYGKTCFQFHVDKEKTYEDAGQYCIDNGGSLALVKSQDINDFLTSTIKDKIKFIGSTWIGLDDKEEENTFKWADGTLVDYSNWDDDDEGPRNGLFQHCLEDCVALNTATNGTWHDYRCGGGLLVSYLDKEFGFVCQYRTRTSTTTSPVIIPTTNIPKRTTKETTHAPMTPSPEGVTTVMSTQSSMPPSQTTTGEKAACPKVTCNLDCQNDGFKLDALTGCALCECDSK